MTRLFVLLGVFGLLSCVAGDIASMEIQGRPPIGRITVVDTATDGRRIGIHLEADVDWRSLVNLDSFNGFQPAMSHQEAREKAGRPDEVGDSAYVYLRPGGRVVITEVVDRSGNEVFKQWQTRFYPTEAGVDDFLSPALTSQLDTLLRERSVLVLFHPSEYTPLLRLRTQDGQVKSVIWYHA